MVVVANELIDLGIARSKTAEHLIDGKPEQAVRDGVIFGPFLNSPTLGTSELFQQLRQKGVRQLGEVAKPEDHSRALFVHIADQAFILSLGNSVCI